MYEFKMTFRKTEVVPGDEIISHGPIKTVRTWIAESQEEAMKGFKEYCHQTIGYTPEILTCEWGAHQ